jgi:peptide-methionine (S)-S-oxide reductase
MKKTIFIVLAAALVIGIAVIQPGAQKAYAEFPDPPLPGNAREKGIQTAVLAGGCFWGMEGVFEDLKGVRDVVSGYSGGAKDTAWYEMVSSGTTGHAESVRITYDPAVVDYGTLLKVFFSVAHDPTQLNYQGPDHGTQYRSVVFFSDDYQKTLAEGYIRALEAARVFPQRIVTEVVPLKAFYPAEEYHQDFMKKNPDYPYIVYWDKPKIAQLEKDFPGLVNGK